MPSKTLQEYAQKFFLGVDWDRFIVEDDEKPEGDTGWAWRWGDGWPEREFKAILARAIADALDES